MSRTKKILLKIWQFISIFGLFIGLLSSYMFLLYARYTRDRLKSEHRSILKIIMNRTKPSIKDISAVFGVLVYYDSSSEEKLKKNWGANTQIIEKFKQHPSMVMCVMGDVIYFIFFDEEGRMVDFVVEDT